MNPLLDKDFLKKLDNINHKEIFARLTSLNFVEMPIEQIEGKITGGSINLDGSSSSRRTCNLTMVAKDVNINEFYWGLTHKIKVEIGVINTIDPEYDNIIWFNQGIFIISTFNVSLTVNNYTITLNAKDKMSLLNGDLGGNLFAQTDFANIENYDNIYEIVTFNEFSEYQANKYYIRTIDPDEPDDTKKEKYIISLGPYSNNETYYEKIQTYQKESLSLKTIIREMIHTYAKEPYFNIVINDLDDSGVELLEYRGSEPLYLVYDIEQDVVKNMTMNGDMKVQIDNIGEFVPLSSVDDSEFVKAVDSLVNTTAPTMCFERDTKVPRTQYKVRKVEYGQTAGFRETDLVYVGELIGNIGETLTSVLDKIKNMLGDFEYFYDIDGRFVFQRQKTYENQSWNSLVKTEDSDLLIENAVENSAIAYSFIDNNIITAFNNSPNLSNLRNDFSIWGIRKGVSGADIPIHLRYVIDTKPNFYTAYDGKVYITSEDILKDELIQNIKTNKNVIAQVTQEVIKEFYNYDRQENPQYPGKQQLPQDWWYMSDWYNYYKKLTGEAPTDYIRFYATNRTGEEEIQGYVENFDPSAYFEVNGSQTIYNKIWLFHLVNDIFQTGSGGSAQHNATTNRIEKENDGTITIAPFSGCTSHKYTDFVTIDSNGFAHDKPGYTGFFYKPNFPTGRVTELIKRQIEIYIDEHIEEYMDEYALENCIICDWREIIYQMAKDYYKHNQEDDFYSQIQNNNGKKANGAYYYPNGITGYEQYYIDIISFWKDLYNLDPDRNYNTFGGYYAEYIDWTQANDFAYQVRTQWVGFERDEGLFETDYFLPEEEKIYDDVNAAAIMAIKSAKIDLQGLIVDQQGEPVNSKTVDEDNEVYLYDKTNKGKIQWDISTESKNEFLRLNNDLHTNILIDNMRYEIYRSFYPTSGYCKVYLDSSSTISEIQHNSSEGGNSYIESNASPFGSINTDLPMYYKVRGIYDLSINGENHRIYTQWSNRINIVYHIEFLLDDLGNRVDDIAGETTKWIYPIDVHYFPFTDVDRTPVVSVVAYQNNFTSDRDYYYWNKNVFEAPEKLNFWFDFLDSDSELAQYKVPVVGDRTKSVNDNKVTSIYFKETPDIIFYTDEEYGQREIKSGYTYFRITDDQKNLFTLSAQYKSAKDVLDEFLYKFSYCVENITITSLPVYYLEPNTRIFVYDENSQINGEYIVSKITLPLTYNGTMQITATKAVSRIY